MNSSPDLQDRIVVISGAARGIGRSLALAFAGQGSRVIGVDVADLGETGALVRQAGAQWLAVEADVSSEEQVRGAWEKIGQRFEQVDVLVNNAALYGGLKARPFQEIPIEEWDRVLAVHVRGIFLMCRHALPLLKRSRAGRIINLASGSALRGSPFLLHYVTSKGAVIGLTRALASELGPEGITVNAIAPGFVANEASRELDATGRILESTIQQQSLKRAQEADDVVGTALYLASGWSGFVTGQLVAVDGGLNKH